MFNREGTRNSEKQASVFKILPIRKLYISSAVKIDVEIRTGDKLDDFEEKSKNKSYYQDIDIKKVSQDIDIEEVSQDINIEEVSDTGREGEYYGEFKWIGDVEVGGLIQELKGKHTKTEPKDPLSNLRQNLFNCKELISKERDFQAIVQGLFMNGELEDGKEIRVYAETNVSPKGRMDLMLSFVHFKEDGSLEEECPMIIELKCADKLGKANKELGTAEKQSDQKYNLIRSCTSKRTANSLVMVFNKGGVSEDKLICTRIKNFKVDHTTSENVPSSESTDSDFEEQELHEFGSQAGSSSEDNSSLVSQVDSFYREQELVNLGSQAGSPPSKRRKRTRSTESQRIVYDKNVIPNKNKKTREKLKSLASHKLKDQDISNEDDNLVKIDVPGDGSCLFWSVALAYLVPYSENEFDERCKLLFGEENSKGLEELRELISSSDFRKNLYDRKSISYGENILKSFINKFRRKVADYISSDQKSKECFDIRSTMTSLQGHPDQEEIFYKKLKGSKKFPFEGKNLTEIANEFYEAKGGENISKANTIFDTIFEIYVECVRDNQFWGSEFEIGAITRMLPLDIFLSKEGTRLPFLGEGNNTSDRKDKTTIELFHVNNNHYQFGIKRDIFQSIAQTLGGRTDLSPKQSDTSNSSTGKENILPHGKPKITEKHFPSSLSQNCLDNVSVQVHSTQARDLGEK